MENFSQPEIFYCLANFLYIITGVYCGVIRLFHSCNHNSNNINTRILIAILFLSQTIEIPYFLNINNKNTLLFVTITSMFLIPILLKLIWERYFLQKKQNFIHIILHLSIPAALIPSLVITLYDKQDGIYQYSDLITPVTTVLFLLMVLLFLIIQVQIIKFKLKESILTLWNKLQYILIIFIIPNAICALVYMQYQTQSQVLKMYLDITFSILEIIMIILLLNNNREKTYCNTIEEDDIHEEEHNEDDIENDENIHIPQRLNKAHSIALFNDIVTLIASKELFKNANFSLDELASLMGSNRNYISEAISQSKYGSFYRMINHFRIQSAMELMNTNPTMKIDDIAISSGFSSRFTFTRIFKEYNKTSPSSWRRNM